MTTVYPAEWTRGRWTFPLHYPVLPAVSIGGGCYQAVEDDGQFLLGHIYRWDDEGGRMMGPFLTREDTEAQASIVVRERTVHSWAGLDQRLTPEEALLAATKAAYRRSIDHDSQRATCTSGRLPG